MKTMVDLLQDLTLILLAISNILHTHQIRDLRNQL